MFDAKEITIPWKIAFILAPVAAPDTLGIVVLHHPTLAQGGIYLSGYCYQFLPSAQGQYGYFNRG